MEFVGLRSKSYSLLFSDDTEKKVCKGVSKTVIKNQLNFLQYKNCLLSTSVSRNQFTAIGSQKQELKTYVKCKISLSAFDSKLLLFDCGIHAVPYGYNVKSFKCAKCV